MCSKLFSRFTVGEEAIMFQGNSPLFKGMTEAFKEGIVFRDSIDYTNIKDSDKVPYRRAKVHQFVKTVVFKKLAKVIKDTTNITVRRIVDVNFFCGLFAVDVSLGDGMSTRDVENNMSGNIIEQTPISESMQELMDFSSKVNTVTSKFTIDKFGKDNNRNLAVTLYMDVDMFYLPRDNVNKEFAEDMSAEEMAAVYVHEIGHVFTLVEYSKNMYYQYDRLTKHINNLGKNSCTPVEFLDIYQKTVKKDIVKNKDKIDKKVVDFMDKVEYMATYYKENQGNDYVSGTLEFIGAIFFNLIHFFLNILVRIYFWGVVFSVNVLVETMGWFMEGNSKTSDVPTTVHNGQYIERLADDFAARHGCAGYLASSLAKIHKLGDTAQVKSASLRDSVVYGNYLKITAGFLKMTGGADTFGMYMPKAYEEFTKRIRRMAQDTISAFKNTDLSSDVRNDFIVQYEGVIKTLNENKKGISDKVFDFMYALTLRWFTYRENKTDWENELNEFDEFINNKLYYQSAKLGSLRK